MKSIDDIYSLPDCKRCNNTRRVIGHDKNYGDRIIQCGCVSYEVRLSALRAAKIPNSHITFDLDDYDPAAPTMFDSDTKKNVTLPQEQIERNRVVKINMAELLRLHQTLINKGIDVIFTGGVSSGKTMMATILLKELILQHGYSGMFVTADELVLMAQHKSSFKKDDFEGHSYEDMLDVDFLLIDNFHNILALSVLQMVKIILRNLIKSRKNASKCTILTARATLKQMLAKDKELAGEFVYTKQEIRLWGEYSKTRVVDNELTLTKYKG